MAEDSAAATIGKFGLGIGAGFGLYWLIRNLGFGAGGGFGGGRGQHEAGQGPEAPAPSPPGPPPIPRDDQPILLWVEALSRTQPPRSKLPDPASRTREDARFMIIDLAGTKTRAELNARVSASVKALLDKSAPSMSLDEAIARIKAGGRDDVRLMSSGGILSGTWDDAKDALMAAGIKHWLLWKEAPADRKPGEPAKPARWELFDMFKAAGNPDKKGHYLVENRGTAHWNLEGDRDPAPRVSGDGRGHYRAISSVGRGYYR